MFRCLAMLSMILLPSCAAAQIAQPVAASPQLSPLSETESQPHQPAPTTPFLDLLARNFDTGFCGQRN